MGRVSDSAKLKDIGNEEVVELLWARSLGTARSRQSAYSRDQIAAAAVQIADKEGIDAASMRRVAAAIGARATSLYRYVRSKEELLDVMVDRVTGEVDIPTSSGNWRSDLRAIAQHMRAVMVRHPWMVTYPAFRSALGPNSLATFEATLKALDGYGLNFDEVLTIATAFATFTRGYAASEIAEQQTETRSGLGHEQWAASQMQYIEMIRATGEYPLFMQMVDSALLSQDPDRAQKEFEQGLEYLLNGIAARFEDAQAAP